MDRNFCRNKSNWLRIGKWFVVPVWIDRVTVGIWRKMEGKAPIKLSGKTVGATLLGVFGALLLGVGMCLSMVFAQMIMGIVVGIIGIVVLLMLIPLLKGLHD